MAVLSAFPPSTPPEALPLASPRMEMTVFLASLPELPAAAPVALPPMAIVVLEVSVPGVPWDVPPLALQPLPMTTV